MMNGVMEQLVRARDRGIISEMAYQFCEFLKRIEPGCPGEVLLAGCLVVARKEEGDVCVELTREAGSMLFADGAGNTGIQAPPVEKWRQICRDSGCVAAPGETAILVLDAADRLYLQKYWKFEQELAEDLIKRAGADDLEFDEKRVREELESLFGTGSGETDWQKVAAFTALSKKLAIISGGPGTGKTSTVVKILMLLARLDALRHVALAAPTGKAAARLRESMTRVLDNFEPEDAVRRRLPDEAQTIHKLLGARRHASDFKYDRDNPLPYDLVVVDEASMVDLALMHQLLQALPGTARLILLGDKDQLASVEAGAVLGSICTSDQNSFSSSFIQQANEVGLSLPDTVREKKPGPLTDQIVLLKKSYRFGATSGIGELARRILSGEADKVSEALHGESYPDVTLEDFRDSDGFRRIIGAYVKHYFEEFHTKSTVEEALHLISRSGILCVHRRGPLGARQVNNLAEQQLRQSKVIPATREWYPGKPVMITRNDYSLGLRNGDLGITLEDEEGRLKVYFPEDENTVRSFYPSRLASVQTSYAITVHKSQGSEFDNVMVVLPGKPSPISTREMLYTAVTRARVKCVIVGSKPVLEESVSRKAERSSGLKDRLWRS